MHTIMIHGLSSMRMRSLFPGTCALVLAFAQPALAARTDPEPMQLWYRQPAGQWVGALPIGNGSMGVMVFGGVEEARYQFNEDTLWAGKPRNYCRPDGARSLPAIQQALLDRLRHLPAGESFTLTPAR